MKTIYSLAQRTSTLHQKSRAKSDSDPVGKKKLAQNHKASRPT